MDWRLLAIGATTISVSFVALTGPIGFAGFGVVIYAVYQDEKEQDKRNEGISVMDGSW